MKLILIAGSMLLITSLCFSSTLKEGIAFLPEETTFQEVLDKAKEENKIIFIDAYTTWCGPCKWLDQNVFTDAEVGNYFNENFISAKFDMEKGEGIELAKKYGVRAYPTLLFLDGDGNMVHRICGAAPAETFLASAKEALDTENRIGTLMSKYEAGVREIPFLRNLMVQASRACMDLGELPQEFWSMQDKSEWSSAENYKVFTTYVRKFDSEEFQYFLKNTEAFKANAENPEQVDKYAEQVLYSTLATSIYKNSLEKFTADKEAIEKLNSPAANKAVSKAVIFQHSRAKDWENYAIEADKFYSSYGTSDASYINSLSWTIYQNIEKKETLLKAATWMKDVVEKHESYAFMDTYAALLLKGGNKSEGEKAANQAIEIAKASGEDYSGTEKILETYH